jgi:hypothetical protein
MRLLTCCRAGHLFSRMRAVQGIQLTWRTVTQLLSSDDMSVVDSTVSLLHEEAVVEMTFSGIKLPICSFATPSTRLGAQCQ